MPSQRQITVRRAPKYVPFLVAGGVLGIILAAVSSFSVPAPKDYTQGSVFGYFMVLFAAGGVLLGGVVALVLDRLSVRRAERGVVEEVEDDTEGNADRAPDGTTDEHVASAAADPIGGQPEAPDEAQSESPHGNDSGPTPAP